MPKSKQQNFHVDWIGILGYIKAIYTKHPSVPGPRILLWH